MLQASFNDGLGDRQDMEQAFPCNTQLLSCNLPQSQSVLSVPQHVLFLCQALRKWLCGWPVGSAKPSSQKAKQHTVFAAVNAGGSGQAWSSWTSCSATCLALMCVFASASLSPENLSRFQQLSISKSQSRNSVSARAVFAVARGIKVL